MSKIGQGCGMLALACVLGATGIAVAQTATEIVLHNFEANLAHGANPYAGGIRDSAGNLYGTTYSGGAANAGVVYQVDTAGHQTVLYSFTGGADGANPYGGVIGDSAGNLYGTTLWGGTGGVGVVYKVGATGETVLHSFTWDADGFLPQAGVIRDPAGNLYGTTSSDGGGGVVYKLDPAGQYTVLCSGYAGRSGVIRDPAGNLYWTGPADQGAVYKLDTAGNVTVLYSFTGRADGGNPQAGVTRDSAGNLYGTTANGGSAGGGVAYKLDTAGNETVLYSFPAGFYGAYPSGVIRDSAGNLYGTTHLGGAAGAGAVYKLDATGQETVVYGFPGAADGSEPWAGVIRDSAGNLYGTTRSGGTANAGVVYKLDTAGRETVLHTFTGGGDGGDPWAGVIRGSAGNLYGTTRGGGKPGASEGCGVVYKLDATGQETVLYTFTGGADGGAPYAGVIRDSAGNFYGTTSAANLRGEGGAVFKLDAAGQETVLYSFPPSCAPRATDGVIRDPAGNLYGTNSCGGATY